MAVKNGIASQGSVSCPRDLPGSGDELLRLNGALAARAEELPADETARHTGSCCLHGEAPGSGQPLADGQVCKNTGLDCSLSRNSLLREQADSPVGKDDSASSAALLEIRTEEIPDVNDDFSDDDLEYFECSDVLTGQENEIWQRKLRFLLESDDEDDLKLSEDCDGCARLLGEVSGDTAPGETPIGFRGHHSTFPGLDVRRDPSMPSQSPPQADMTLAVGHRRQGSAGPEDEHGAPVASAGAADEHLGSPGDADASGHLAGTARHSDPAPADPAGAGADPSAAGTMPGAGAARGESSPLPEEGDGEGKPQENPRHAGCAFAETLRRNLFKLLNPLELCRYVSAIGQSLQAPSPAPEGVLIPKETESLEVQAEEADKDCQWEGRRTQGLPEQSQMPDENASLGDHGAHLESVPQNCDNLCVETEGTLRAGESGGSSQPAAGMLSADVTLPAENAELQTPPLAPALPCGPSGGADALPALQSGCRGDADGSAVRDELWKLLHEDDSEGQVPLADRGVTSWETRPAGVQVTEQESCCHPPLLMDGMEEREPLPAASPGRAGRGDRPILRGAAAPPACLAADGAGDEVEAPAARPAANSTFPRPGLHPEHGVSWGDESVPGEGCHFRGGPADCPEEKGLFPSDNTCQLTRAGHCSVGTVHGRYKLNLQAGGDGSDSNAQSDTDSQGCHLPKIDSCQDFQAVSAAQEHGSVMQLPALIETPATITGENRPQSAEQLPETAEQDGAFAPSSRDLPLSDFCVEMPSCEAAKPGDQSEIPTADEHRAGISRDPGVTRVPEGPSAVSPHYTAEQQGRGDQPDAQQLPGAATLLLLTPASPSQDLLVKKTGSTPSGDEGNRNLSVLETSCGASQGLFQRAPAQTQGEGDECERPRVVGHSPDEAETKAALTLISSQAQGQVVNTGTEQSCPDGIPPSEADCSISDKEEEVRAAESVVNCGLAHLPPVDSGSKGCFEEQTRLLSVASTARDPLAIDAERQQNQEGSKPCQAEPEPPRCKQDAAKGGHSAAGAKKKLPPAALPKKPRLEEKGGGKKSGKGEAGGTRREERKPEQRKLVLKKDSKAPRLLKKIQAESFPEGSGNVRLCCQFGDIHGDSTVTWTKDSKVLARLHRSAQDDSPVSLEIAKAASKDQGMYYCCLHNAFGKVTAEFHLTAAVLERLSSFRSYEGVEEIEFMQLLFRDDSISDSYFGGHLHGVLATEQLHFGEGMHRRAFRSRVRRGLAPVFAPGHPCVLKVHSALSPAAGTREELVRKNYNLALQECCVQNAAREYAKLYAAEAETLEGFGEVPEIIPIFLIHRPANAIPYATVEEELVGEFVKYSVRDGKEVNFLRRDSEAGQKCCTFQHWVYERTSGNLLVTDLQGVGMKLTDVGIATLAKGYKGFKGNCSFSFIEQFRALHQCNEYCQMLGLKSLRATHQKQRKAAAPKGKNPPSSSAGKRTLPKKGREHRDFISSEH